MIYFIEAHRPRADDVAGHLEDEPADPWKAPVRSLARAIVERPAGD